MIRKWCAGGRIDAEYAVLLPPSSSGRDTDATKHTSLPAELPQVSGYRVERVLGHGGMGVVYHAWHFRLDRAVALKMLLAGPYARTDERERFLREAQALAALRHPNIGITVAEGHSSPTLRLFEEVTAGP